MEVATRSTNTIYVSENFFSKLIKTEQQQRVQECIDTIQDVLRKLKQVINKEFVTIKNKKFVYNRTYNILLADTTRWTCSTNRFDYELFEQEGKKGRRMKEKEVKDLFYEKKSDNPLIHYNSSNNNNYDSRYSENYYFLKNKNSDSNSYCYYSYVGYKYPDDNSRKLSFHITNGYSNFNNITDSNVPCLPVSNCEKYAYLHILFLEEKWIPKEFNEKEEKILQEIMELYHKKLITINADTGLLDEDNNFAENVKNNKINSFQSITLTLEGIGNYIKSVTVTLSPEAKKLLTTYLLECDFLRADIDPYDQKILEDPNRGHWEIWTDKERENTVKITLDTYFVARNPLSDVKEDGIIGIDFGTKSTVVACQDGDDNTLLMRVGRGKYRKEIKKSDYENPTVMEFIDIENFMKQYSLKNGRPETLWEDLTVSHSAAEQLKNGKDSSKYYTFFSDLKQWSGDKNRKIRIKDDRNHETVLPAFVEIQDGDFNPIELYAYYLGLFINNMYKGIYINYLLSFPVTYEKKVREKIIHSFERGIKKSLPDEILNDEQTMKNFRITQGASEPAAYAICALEGYGFEPEEDEEVFYGIFDFGGGTTDFDFGLWKCAKGKEARRYDYVIQHFGAGGDQYLGGENLLELLAFHVFKNNSNALLSSNISFYKPVECKDFAGSEALLSNSQEAKLNTRQLMEKLRDLWERPNEQSEEINKIKEGQIELMLFTNTGEEKANFPLDVNSDELLQILRDRIEIGVKNFFDALKLNFLRNDTVNVNSINIFLAGNSSKSPIVKQLFDEYIAERTNEIKQNFECNQDQDFFIIYPPLGTEEAKEIQKQRGIEVNTDEITSPTGKTGVAFGLIEGRPGSKIKVISEITDQDEIKFKYYLGVRNRKKYFECVIDRSQEYYQWNCFIDASVEDFEIYYTSLPEATTKNSLAIENVKKKLCRIDEANDNADIYIRFVSPNTIEYVVATKEGIEKNEYVSEIKKLEF